MEIGKETNVKKPHLGEKLVIDNTFEVNDILKAHKEGYSIHFNGEEGKFIDLSEEDFDKLPKSLLVYYMTALKENAGQLNSVVKTMAESNTLGRTFGYDRRTASSKDQLEVELKVPGMQPRWVRAYDNELAQAERDGYVAVRGDQAVTFGNDGTKEGGHYVGSEAKPEMALMMISDENWKANEKRAKAFSEEFKKATEEGFKKDGQSVDSEVEFEAKSGLTKMEDL